MKRIRIAECLLAGFAVLLFTAGNAMAKDDASNAKANAEAKAKAEAGDKAKAEAAAKSNTKVNLDGSSLSTVLDRLFGTPEDGLLDGKGSFNLHAENMTMTSAESAAFFAAVDSEQGLAAAIRAAEPLHGVIRLEGAIDGQPFELKFSGRQLKIEGLTLTAAQRDTLIAELRGVEGLKEMKIEATMDGQKTMTRIQGGQEKFEILGSKKPDRDQESRGKSGVGVEKSARVDARERIDGPVRVDGAQRIEGGGRIGIERVVPGLGRR
jgi:hypothetical protein